MFLVGYWTLSAKRDSTHNPFMKRLWLLAFWLSVAAPVWAADMVITNRGKPVCENFNDFEGTFESLPPEFAVSKDGSNCLTAADSADFKPPHSGGTTEGACRPWKLSSGNHALGYQPTSTEFTPGFFMATISNATGEAVALVEVSYEIVCYNNENRSSSLDFEYSRDGIVFSRIAAAAYTSPEREDNPAHWTITGRSVAIHLRKQPLVAGGRLWLRWYGDDNGGAGSRDEYGIDNVEVVLRSRRGTVITVE